MLAFWGLILPISSWLIFPIAFFMGTIGAMVKSSMYDTVTPPGSPNQVRDTAANSGFSANIAARLSGASMLVFILYSVLSMIPTFLIRHLVLGQTRVSFHIWVAVMGWYTVLSLSTFIVLPAGLVRVVRTKSIIAIASPRTFAAVTSTSYLKAMFVAGVVLAGYCLLLPFTVIIPLLGFMLWGAGLAVVLGALSIYIATRTPGLPEEFRTEDGMVQRDLRTVGEPTLQQ
jgi:hypothetical protein